ncbi:MAG: TonB-dependent receptor [Proteobacteria bacterium]|nr:TonB-dependent receptor [Pseudomonadota bacterium]
MKRSLMKIVLMGFLGIMALLVNIAVAFAEEREKEIKLEEIVVTATRTEKEITEVPASVSVVTKKDIEKRNILTVEGALNTVPGFFTRREEGIVGLVPVFSLRGIPGQNRTLVLMDGMTLNEPRTGAAYLDGIPPENVERIEVVRGPFSSLYGGYAMGGVVNIITKMPEKREFTIKSGYGSSWDRGEGWDDMSKFYLSCGDKLKDKLSLFLSYGYKGTNGYPLNSNVQSKQPTAGITGWSSTTDREGNSRYLIGDMGDQKRWDDGATFKVGYDFSKTSKLTLSFMGIRDGQYEYEEPHTYLKDATGNPVWSYGSVKESSFLSGSGGKERNIYNLSYETEIALAKAKISLTYLDQGKSWYTTPDTTATRTGGPGKVSNSPSESYNADLQVSLPLLKSHILTVGGSFRQNEADSKNHNLSNWKDEDSKTTLYYESEGKDRTYSLFVQDEMMILDNLTAYLGFRQDWWETYDGYANDVGKTGYPKHYDSRDVSSFSPKAALIYKPFEKTTLRTSIGKAFRPPTVYDLYYTYTSSLGVTYEANKDLKPETTVSWDIGAEQELWKGAKVKATYFENNMKDLIYTKTISPTYNERINVGKAKSEGIELEAEQRFEKWLRIFVNFAYTKSKIKENEAKPETVGKQLTDLPERIFNVGAEMEKGPFSASITGRYVSKRYSTDENKDTVNHVQGSYDPFFKADAKISYKITKFATLSLSVDNIFDEDHFYYYKAPGRSWFSELTLRF